MPKMLFITGQNELSNTVAALISCSCGGAKRQLSCFLVSHFHIPRSQMLNRELGSIPERWGQFLKDRVNSLKTKRPESIQCTLNLGGYDRDEDDIMNKLIHT